MMIDKEQIDACVILEMLLEQKRTKDQRLLQQKCRQYFHRIGEQGTGFISLPALGEVFVTIYEVQDEKKRMNLFTRICDVISRCNLLFNTPTRKTYDVVREIMDFDNRISPADALRLAEAITEKATFVTLDGTLKNNVYLQREFNIRIKEPY